MGGHNGGIQRHHRGLQERAEKRKMGKMGRHPTTAHTTRASLNWYMGALAIVMMAFSLLCVVFVERTHIDKAREDVQAHSIRASPTHARTRARIAV